jgi:hypothetical protein
MKMKEAQGLYNPAQGMRPEDWFKNALTQAQKPKARMQGRRPTGFNPNAHEAWSIPLSQLVNLWQAKYGDTWIDVSDLDDAFWPEASARLHMNNKMEAYDRDSTPWARLKEDA